jgi:hypothetical protein
VHIALAQGRCAAHRTPAPNPNPPSLSPCSFRPALRLSPFESLRIIPLPELTPSPPPPLLSLSSIAAITWALFPSSPVAEAFLAIFGGGAAAVAALRSMGGEPAFSWSFHSWGGGRGGRQYDIDHHNWWTLLLLLYIYIYII